VQTSALDEDRLFAAHPAETGLEGPGPVAGAEPRT
jgi:hypothetical protein